MSLLRGMSALCCPQASCPTPKFPRLWMSQILIQSQIQSYEWFKTEALTEVYQEISPIARLHRQEVRAAFPGALLPAAKILASGVQGAGNHFLAASLRQDTAGDEGDWGDQGAGDLHGRHPHDDAKWHLRHQRLRAGGGEPAGALAGHLLRLRGKTWSVTATCVPPS